MGPVGSFQQSVNTIEIFLALAAIVAFLTAIIAAGRALEASSARKRAASLLGSACPFCGISIRDDTILTARMVNGFDDDGVTVVCSNCSKSVIKNI